MTSEDIATLYVIAAYIIGILSGICIWGYSIISWGILFGLMFGWIPALIGGFILGIFWPLVLIGIVWIGIQILKYN